MSDPRRRLPAITALLGRDEVAAAIGEHGRERVLAALRQALDEHRRMLERIGDEVAAGQEGVAAGGSDGEVAARSGGGPVLGEDGSVAAVLAARALASIEREQRRRLRRVINATGVILHTNLGRAPLPASAVEAVAAAAGATNLETDLETGERGGRTAVIRASIARMTGAEDAMVVNNGAAALVLVLSVLARGRSVVVSRGELVEIGGSFRLPEIVETAGVALREVGTTNRTHLDDYRRAVDQDVGAVLRVHPSNFRIEGFVHRPTVAEIADVAHEADVPFVVDVGSGLLHDDGAVAPGEPTAASALEAGADVVVFSGDKLLGGPQAGLVVGRASVIERCRQAPLTRALRLDKLRIAALEATLASHERAVLGEIPLWALATADPDMLHTRARRLAAACDGEVVATRAVLGGGSVPGHTLASWGVALAGEAESLARRLRTGDPAVHPRIVDETVVIDLRSVPDHLDDALVTAVAAAVTDAADAT